MEAKIRGFSEAQLPKKVLVAPLDWGLGHATRCIPLVHALLRRGCSVYLAGEPPVQSLLQAEFPNLPWLPLKGYRVRYGRTAPGTALRLAAQLPRLVQAIRYEHRWLHRQVLQHGFDLVISDNRYGLYHPGVYSIFVGHQLQVQTPWPAATRWMQQVHYRFIRHFHACWVPDFPGEPNLSGLLAHPPRMPAVPTWYIGPLSRMQGRKAAGDQTFILLLLSGPEPQRGILEEKLVRQASAIDHNFILVRGLPGATALPRLPHNIQAYNHLDTPALQRLLQQAMVVVCRSGYSTVMDLAAVAQKSILVPTPGQTEQQYLARHLQGLAICRRQVDLDLGEALQAAMTFTYRPWPRQNDSLLQQALNQLFEQLATTPVRTEKEYRI